MPVKILISDPLAKEGVDILKSHKGFVVDEVSKLSEAELVRKIKGYDALIVRSGTTVTRKIIEASDNLKVIGRAGVGLDNVDVAAASKKGVVVMNAPTGNTISTAEHAFGLMMALSRNIPMAN
ncbi:MAG: phosphoglycerate dehydrogenase, partial [Candidatus Omnitrophica bacterium]|nr:phosphoglycerate dehydrogenase [Candidatus Omnitrophota bacterium]